MNEMTTMPTLETRQVKRLIKESSSSSARTKNSSTDTSNSKDIFLKRQTAKSFIVQGIDDNNYPWPEGLHGQFVSIGNGNKAWQFSNKRQVDVALVLGIANDIKP